MAKEENLPLERVFSSIGRVRILSLLSEVEELHLTEIAKRTEQSYSSTERHLDELSEAGIVEERDYGRIRVFKLNRANGHAKLLQELVLKWNQTPESRPVQAQA